MKEVGGRRGRREDRQGSPVGCVGSLVSLARYSSLLVVEGETDEERGSRRRSPRPLALSCAPPCRLDGQASSCITSPRSLAPHLPSQNPHRARRPTSLDPSPPRRQSPLVDHGFAEHARRLRRRRHSRLSPAAQELVGIVCVYPLPSSNLASTALTSSPRPSRLTRPAGKCLCCPCYLICGVALSRGASSLFHGPPRSRG